MTVRKNIDMGQGSVGKTLFRLAVPSVVSMFFHTLFHLVDTLFIAWLGEASLAAMSLTFPVIFSAFALFNGISVGATSLMSQALGAGSQNEAGEMAQTAWLLAFAASLPSLALLDRDLCEAFFRLLGGSGPVLAESYRYNTWLVASFPLMAYSLVADSLFRSQGDTVTPMISMVLGNLLNAVLDPLLIFGLGQGISGAALATFLSRAASCAYLATRMNSHSRFRLDLKGPSHGFLKRAGLLLRTGLPVSISQGSMALGVGILNRILSRFGAAAIGAWMLGNRVEGLAFLPVFGINGALIPFVGFNLGKNDLRRVRQAVKAAAAASTLFMTGVGIMIYAWPQPVLALFRPTPLVSDLAIASIRASATGYIFAALDITFWGVFQGTGHSSFGMVAQFVRTIGVRVPLALWLSSRRGLGGLWWCQPLSVMASFAVSALLLVYLFRKLGKELPGDVSAKQAIDNPQTEH
jgi:putative MATE family efflux protein